MQNGLTKRGAPTFSTTQNLPVQTHIPYREFTHIPLRISGPALLLDLNENQQNTASCVDELCRWCSPRRFLMSSLCWSCCRLQSTICRQASFHEDGRLDGQRRGQSRGQQRRCRDSLFAFPSKRCQQREQSRRRDLFTEVTMRQSRIQTNHSTLFWCLQN